MERTMRPAQPLETQYTLDTKSQHSECVSSLGSPISFENKIEDNQPWSPHRSRSSAYDIVWPATVVCVPMLLLCTALLAVVFGYEVRPGNNIFATNARSKHHLESGYLLVNYSDTKIVFLASSLSTVAPLLAGCVMAVASISLIRRFQHETALTSESHQDALLAGLMAASYRKLFLSLRYLVQRAEKEQRAAISYAAGLLLLTVLMGLAVTVSDATLHLLTETINFTLYSEVSTPSVEHGRGLNSLCANFDRVRRNYGFPCTTVMNTDFVDPNMYTEQAESLRLWHNTSDQSEIRYHQKIGNLESGLSYLVPRPPTVDSTIDYEAATVGVSATCSLIPASTCNLTRWGPYNKAYTSFNCSQNFWGSLGLAENTSSVNSYRSPSPYLPLLSLKPQANLQFGFYSDNSLRTSYNPAGINASIQPDPDLQPTPNEDLPASIYMALAWRSAWSVFAGGAKNGMIASNQTGVYPGIYYVDYFLNCEVTAYNVDYIWFDGNVRSVSAEPITNGSVVNMWQGTTPYRPSINGGGTVLQDINGQAAIAGNTVEDYESKFSELLSLHALATIGGYMSPRTVVRQQKQQVIMLAKVPKAALGSLIACSLLYPVLGVFLLFKACRTFKNEPACTSDESSITDSPFKLPAVSTSHPDQTPSPSMFRSSAATGVTEHTRPDRSVNRNSTAGFRFVLWGNAGVGPSFKHLLPEKDAAGSIK